MTKSKILVFIKLNILIVPLFLIISYFIVPIFSSSSPCYDLASSPADSIVLSVPCIKLTTIPEHFQQTYITKFGFHYQSNAFYTYDLTAKYMIPLLNTLFAYFLSYAVVLCLGYIAGYKKRLFKQTSLL